MAKNKSFDFQALIPQAEIPAPAVKVEKIPVPEPEVKTEEIVEREVPVAVVAAAHEPHVDTPDLQPETKGRLSMLPNQKKKKGKRVNFLVNEAEYQEFTEINKRLGYSNNEMVSRLIAEFIRANG